MVKFPVVAAALASVSVFHQTDAHGYISRPQATYIDTFSKTKYNALMSAPSSPAFSGRKWNGSPIENAQQFTEAFKVSRIPSLKAMLDVPVPGCANTRVDNVPPVSVASMSTMEFRNDEAGEGFISSHHGPCEVWIDNKRVFHGDDCRAQFQGFPASIPVDYSLCRGECTLTFYWLAVHEPQWQVYKQCVRIHNTAHNIRRD